MRQSEHISDQDFLAHNASLLFDISKRNQLYHTDIAKLWFCDLKEDQAKVNKIYSFAQSFKKEFAINTALWVTHFIKWKPNKKDDFIITPLIYKPCEIIKTKRESEKFEIKILDEGLIVNPIIIYLFKSNFELDLPITINDGNELINFILNEFTSCRLTDNFDLNEWSIIQLNAIGNFNYKKIVAYHDYQILALEKSGLHLSLNGNFTKEIRANGEAFQTHILDANQQKAIQLALRDNTIVQGPPGTGKSTFVVALIEQLLLNNKKVLFVSEKKAALDVVYQKLIKDKLDFATAYLGGAKNDKVNFYKSIGKTISELKNIAQIKSVKLDIAINKVIAYYQNNYLNKENRVIEIEESLIDTINYNFQIKGTIPDYDLWKTHENELLAIEQLMPQKILADNIFLQLNTSIYKDLNTTLVKHIQSALTLCNEIVGLEKLLDKSVTYEGIIHLSITASILKLVNRDALFLIDEAHKKYKSFNTLAKKYQQVEIKLARQQKINEQWKQKPSPSEIIIMIEGLKNPAASKNKSILARIKRNRIKNVDYFAEFPKDLTSIAKIQLLQELQQEWKLQDELSQLALKLKYEFHIFNPQQEIDQILKIRLKLKAIGGNYYNDILSFPNHIEIIDALDNQHQTIQRINGILTYLGLNYKDKSIAEIICEIEEVEHNISQIKNNIHAYLTWSKIPFGIRNFITSYKLSVRELTSVVSQNKLLLQTKFTPEYQELTGKNLLRQIELESKKIKSNKQQISEIIKSRIAHKLNEIERLLLKSNPTPSERDLKAKFKHQKRKLLHETKKSKSHLSLKEITNSCNDMVFELKPIWIMNPLEVATNFGCIPELFDVVIFDEASQIFAEDALPVLFRAKQAVIVGDSNQMPPGDFFNSNQNAISLLDLATIYYQEIQLNHHYRSKHPLLIQFSNNHFYQGNLKTLPPINDKNPLKLVQVNGVFENNTNLDEADKVAGIYKDFIASNIKNVAIITFSLEQQKLIEDKIQQLNIEPNELLLVRNIENMQGHEREHVIISMAYAKNKAGKMLLNFGPINQNNGLKRFNVMITRASKSLQFVTSISANDLIHSTNEGINTIYDYIQFLTENKTIQNNELPQSKTSAIIYQYLNDQKIEFNFFSAVNSNYVVTAFVSNKLNKIILINPGLELESNLLNLVESCSNNFSAILITTTRDLLYQKKDTLASIKNFFTK